MFKSRDVRAGDDFRAVYMDDVIPAVHVRESRDARCGAEDDEDCAEDCRASAHIAAQMYVLLCTDSPSCVERKRPADFVLRGVPVFSQRFR